MTYLILIPIVYIIILVVDMEFYDCHDEIVKEHHETD